ncbi:c-type cytochrome [Mesorhizobium sp.]|uniref:c-type cytochrome n=1 Tax=Mesorhizobium sp. TaxID=1871066 RepID=UPI000FE6CE4E|nr:c-type cytochrome [Mesorhizobium sp.]RWP31981.1 MAG: cytochrome c [Mesorhizobium sp.]
MLALAALVVVCVVLVFGGKSGGLLKPDDARVIARGEAVYVAHCASCHGKNLEGQPGWKAQDKDGFLPAPPHDESGHTWLHPDTLLFRITKLGVAEAANLKDYKTRMPAFGGILTDADIIAALSYIKSRWPDDMRRRHDELNRVFALRESSAR